MLLCRPPSFVNAMKGSVVELGWDKPRAVSGPGFCFRGMNRAVVSMERVVIARLRGSDKASL